MIPDFIKLENAFAKSHKNRIRNPKSVKPLTRKHICGDLLHEALSVLEAWAMLSNGFNLCRIPEKYEKEEGVLCGVTIDAVIGRAGSSWEILAGAIYGFHSDGPFLMPLVQNAYTDPSERRAQLVGDKRGRGVRKSMFNAFTMAESHFKSVSTLSFHCSLGFVITSNI